MDDVLVRLVEIDPLPDDRAIVVMQRKSGAVIDARALQVARLDFEQIIATGPVLVDLTADRIARSR